MTDNERRTGTERRALDSRELRLVIPIACVAAGIWIAAGVRAAITGETEFFLIATGPFGLLCGYLFGGTIIREARSGK